MKFISTRLINKMQIILILIIFSAIVVQHKLNDGVCQFAQDLPKSIDGWLLKGKIPNSRSKYPILVNKVIQIVYWFNLYLTKILYGSHCMYPKCIPTSSHHINFIRDCIKVSFIHLFVYFKCDFNHFILLNSFLLCK